MIEARIDQKNKRMEEVLIGASLLDLWATGNAYRTGNSWRKKE